MNGIDNTWRERRRCPIARSLDIIGERWTILILRDLVRFGPRKFHDFERSLSPHVGIDNADQFTAAPHPSRGDLGRAFRY
jgi:hypothetical protein